MNFKIIFLSLLLVLGVKSKSFAQQDSVVLIGYFVNDNYAPAKNVWFQIFYRYNFNQLNVDFTKSPLFTTDKDGCFEIKVPNTIFLTQAYFKFEDNNYKDFMIHTRPEDWEIKIDFNLNSGSADIYLPPILHYGTITPKIIYPLKIVGHPFIYGEQEIEMRKIENILNDIR